MIGVDDVVASVPEIFKTIAGINQVAQANKLNPQRPTYSVPAGVNEAVNIARAQYYNPRLPQEDYISGRIGASAANSVRAAVQAGRTPAEILAAAAGAEDNQNEALTNLALEGERAKNVNASMLEGQLDNQGVWQDRASDYNQRQPYQEEVNAKSALTQAGNENIYGGMKGLASAVIETGSNTGSNSGIANPYLSSPSNNGNISDILKTMTGNGSTTINNGTISSLNPQIPSTLSKLFPTYKF